MSGMTSFPVADWFTADMLELLPDDGQRYELVEGQVLVTSSPTWQHQNVVTELLLLLRLAVPPQLKVFAGPLDVRMSDRLQVQPDLLVVPRSELVAARIESAPLLVVEVLSDSTRGRDQLIKRRAYQSAGVRSYWMVDPMRPSLTVLELDGGAYREIADLEGEQVWTAALPYPVTITPAALLR